MVVATQQYCTFWLEDQFFGIDAQQVQEVIRHQEMTDVPLANSCIRGLINLRGQIVTAIELRTLFELRARTPDELPMNVVIRTEDGPLSLLVDKIGDVVNVAELGFETPPETTKSSLRELVSGAYKLKNQLLQIVKLPEVVTATTGVA